MVLEACPLFFAYKGLWCLRCSDVMDRDVDFHLEGGGGRGITGIGEEADLLFFDSGGRGRRV